MFSRLAWADAGVEAPEGYDFDVAKQKLRKLLAEVEKHATQHAARLDDPKFLSKADPSTVTEAGERLAQLLTERHMLTEQLMQLVG